MKPKTINIILSVVIAALIVLIVCYWPWRAVKPDKPAKPFDIASLIDDVKSELITSEENQIKKGQAAMFAVDGFDLEIKFTVNKTSTNGGQVQFNFVSVGESESKTNELVQTIKLHMRAIPPVQGSSLPLNKSESRKRGNVQTQDGISKDLVKWEFKAKVKPGTYDSVIVDLSDKTVSYMGLRAIVEYKIAPEKTFRRDTIALAQPFATFKPKRAYPFPLKNLPAHASHVAAIKLLYFMDVSGFYQDVEMAHPQSL